MLAAGEIPELTFHTGARFHVFLSHVWSSGQDQVAVLKRQLQLLMPGISVFLVRDLLIEQFVMPLCIADDRCLDKFNRTSTTSMISHSSSAILRSRNRFSYFSRRDTSSARTVRSFAAASALGLCALCARLTEICDVHNPLNRSARTRLRAPAK